MPSSATQGRKEGRTLKKSLNETVRTLSYVEKEGKRTWKKEQRGRKKKKTRGRSVEHSTCPGEIPGEIPPAGRGWAGEGVTY